MPVTSPSSHSPAMNRTATELVPPWAIAILLVWFVFLSTILAYGLVQLWPPPGLQPSPAVATTSSGTGAGSSFGQGGNAATGSPLNSAKPETRFFLLVLLAGGVGAMVPVFRSFAWDVGQRMLFPNRVKYYLLRPLAGATFAIVLSLVIRLGFARDLAQSNPIGFVALAAVAGLFNEQAARKLKEVAEKLKERLRLYSSRLQNRFRLLKS